MSTEDQAQPEPAPAPEDEADAQAEADVQAEAAAQLEAGLEGAEDQAEAQTQGEPAPDRVERSEELIQRHTLGAVGIGLLPVPGLDMAALVALQLNMLRALGDLYEQPLVDSLGRSIIASLIGGIAPLTSLSVLKFIPVIGTLLASISAPVFTGASTYALGRVFVLHFESGGTFLSLDPDKVRAHYEAEFARAQQLVREQRFRNIRP